MSMQKVAQFVEQSKAVIADLKKVAEDKSAEAATAKTELAATKAELTKIAEARTADQAKMRKLAADTANYLLQQKVIAAADLQKFAEGLADPGAVHNMVQNLSMKLASAQAPVKLGTPSQRKVASADSEKLSANDAFEQNLRAATGR